MFLKSYFKKAPLPIAYPNYYMVVLGAVCWIVSYSRIC